MDEQLRFREVDRRIAALAHRQHGVVARRQLAEVGLGRGAIDHRLGCGRLLVVHRGVYAVGYRRMTRQARWMAAVLAAGPGAVLSHRAAAALWQIRRPDGIEVTRESKGRSRPGITVHTAPLPPDEVTEVDGIPTTTVPRTLLDLAAVVSEREFTRAAN